MSRDGLLDLAEGPADGAQTTGLVLFGPSARAIQLARRGERCLWLWLAGGLCAPFERYREEARGDAFFSRSELDWGETGEAFPAPRPPPGPALRPAPVPDEEAPSPWLRLLGWLAGVRAA